MKLKDLYLGTNRTGVLDGVTMRKGIHQRDRKLDGGCQEESV